jgi:hypothetical protein
MGRRPPHLKPPGHWTKDPSPPPGPGREEAESGGPKGREPTRYGDWESKGIAVDF